ncbi:MAG: hypothetical protein IKN98_07980 [Bacteroidales bacterium]|nr:hypothetical protein [Bacteroidales bacterium]
MRTIVLTCTSEFLSNSYADRIFKNDDYYRIPYWTVHQPDGIVQDVIFYMLRIGKKDKEIVMKGRFRSAPNPDLYWRGNGPRRYWVELLVEQLIHPVIGPTLGKDQLSAAIPAVNWEDTPLEMMLTEEESEKLEQLWEQHVELHSTDFQNPRKVRHIQEEYDKLGIGERARTKIKGVEKLSEFMDNGMCFHDGVVQKMEYDRDKNELQLLIDTYCIPYGSQIKSTYLIPFHFKDVVEIKLDMEPYNDYIWHTRIYQDNNFITAEFESAHLKVCSSELEIGEVVEIKHENEEKGNKFKF